MRRCVPLTLAIFGLAGLLPAPIHAQGAHGPGTIVFRATVAGAVRDSGTIGVPQGMVTDTIGDTDFNGCALVKNKQQEVELEVYNYRANVSAYDTTLSLAFVIGGHLYFTGTHTTVTTRNGGLDGTISSRDLLRTYPSRVSDLTLRASWHCTTLFHVQGKV